MGKCRYVSKVWWNSWGSKQNTDKKGIIGEKTKDEKVDESQRKVLPSLPREEGNGAKHRLQISRGESQHANKGGKWSEKGQDRGERLEALV